MASPLEDIFGTFVQRRTKDKLQKQPDIVTTHMTSASEDPVFNIIGQALMTDTPGLMNAIRNTPPSENVEVERGYYNPNKDQSRLLRDEDGMMLQLFKSLGFGGL